MKSTDYVNKMETTPKKVKKVKKDSYKCISPNGNQYSIKADKLEHFKETMRVTDEWSIT